MSDRLPNPAVLMLVGPSGSGKSTWAKARYLPTEIVSSDALRAVVGSGEADQSASADAFQLLDLMVSARIGRGLTTVVDTLGMDAKRRKQIRALAAAQGLPAIAVVFGTDPQECRRRNAQRDRRVPADVLTAQIARMASVCEQIAGEGWDLVLRVDDEVTPTQVAAAPAAATAAAKTDRLSFRLQISRFPWGEAPAQWLSEVAAAAADSGFDGIALMDHLIQIPQVDRAWEPIPDPWVTLGLLAAAQPGLMLGTLVSPVSIRSAGVLAKAAASLDVLSGGRAFLGIGAGWWQREHAAFGLPFGSTAERLDALEMAVETIRALWRPGTKAYQGKGVDLPETTFYPRPVGPLPIIVGGGGERRTLRIAAQWADAVNVPSQIDGLRRKIDVLRAHCHDVGRDPAEVELTVLDVPVVGTDRADTARRVERLRGRTTAAAFAQRHHAGEPADHIARYEQLAELGVRTVFMALPDLDGPQDVARLAPVIEHVR